MRDVYGYHLIVLERRTHQIILVVGNRRFGEDASESLYKDKHDDIKL